LGAHHTKPDVVVPVVWVVPVAIRAPQVISVVVPRAATKSPRLCLAHFRLAVTKFF